MIDRFLCAADAKRALRTLDKLARHDISRWALAGGLAVEIYSLRGGLPSSNRRLNDIDFVAPSFDCIPGSLAGDFLFRHVHPCDPPGKTILQLVDAETALRIDVFRAFEAMMTRTPSLEFPFGSIQLISCADVLAHTVRLLLDLRGDVPVPAKHAQDYLRLDKLIDPSDVEAAWPDHRKAGHPVRFAEANAVVRDLIATHRDWLVVPEYSKSPIQVCSRCMPTAEFPLADPRLVLSLLGYC